MFRARAVSFVVGAMLVVACFAACAADQSSSNKSATPTNGGAAADFPPIGEAREELKKSERDVDAAMSDCITACKALASLERAVNHICAVAEPDECNDARMRALKARKAINAQCGGC